MRANGACAWALTCLATTAAHAQDTQRVSRAPFGVTAQGETVDVITLRNRHGNSMRVLTRGAAIIELTAPDRRGKHTNVLLTTQNFLTSETVNCVIGRFANRIAGGGFTLDGRFYPLSGADPRTKVVSHGGRPGFAAKLWQATTAERADAAMVKLGYVSADGENGFPGELTVSIVYTFDDAGMLQIDYEARTTKPTVINLTNHAYFNLGGHESGPVYGHWLQVFADRYTPTDENQVPTGVIASVTGTPFDFQQPARLLERLYSAHPQMLLGRGLDHNLVLAKPPGPALTVAARLYDPASGRQLEVRTTEPAVQVYTANFMNGTTAAGNGLTLRQGDGITFETQHYPDSPNQPAFPSTVLRPGEVFRSTTQFSFSTDRRQRFFKGVP